MKIRTYSELILYDSYIERFRYLKLNGIVGRDTFGYDRYLNQMLYNLDEWKYVRNKVIMRDNGCDLGIKDREIKHSIIVHHMNPITVEDIKTMNPIIFDMDGLISTVLKTHNAIHYGSEEQVSFELKERTPNDTIPWR